MPPIGEEISPDLEKQLSVSVAEAAERLKQTNTQQMEQQRIQEQMQDPLIQARLKELEIKEAEVQRKAQEGQAKIQL